MINFYPPESIKNYWFPNDFRGWKLFNSIKFTQYPKQNFATIPKDSWYHELIFVGCQRVFQVDLEDVIPTLRRWNLGAESKSNEKKQEKEKLVN